VAGRDHLAQLDFEADTDRRRAARHRIAEDRAAGRVEVEEDLGTRARPGRGWGHRLGCLGDGLRRRGHGRAGTEYEEERHQHQRHHADHSEQAHLAAAVVVFRFFGFELEVGRLLLRGELFRGRHQRRVVGRATVLA
jgi:hypothetical protein